MPALVSGWSGCGLTLQSMLKSLSVAAATVCGSMPDSTSMMFSGYWYSLEPVHMLEGLDRGSVLKSMIEESPCGCYGRL